MESALYRQLAQTEREHWWFRGRREVLEGLLRRHAPAQPRRILEVGCGTGGNLRLLSSFGPVEGIESSPEARALVDRELGVAVPDGALPDHVHAAEGAWDWVCLFDVLEHVDADVAALTTCRRLLAPGGAIVLTVPAFQWLWSQHDDMHHHRRRYTRRRLADAAAAAGLSISYSTYFNTFLFPLVALARLKDRVLPGRGPTGLSVPPAPINAALRALFGFEAWCLRAVRFPFGVSLAAVLKPR